MAKSTARTIRGRDFLIKELAAFEKRLNARLDMKFEIQAESFKAFVDSRFNTLDRKFDTKIDDLDKKVEKLDMKVEKLDKKLDTRVDGLVDLIERTNGEMLNHHRRISALEARA